MAKITLRQLLEHAAEHSYGLRKVNIHIAYRLAMAGAIRREATTTNSEFDPREFLQPALDAMKALCKDRYEQFGTAGQAAKIRPIPLGEIARQYAAGTLDPVIADRIRAAS